MKKQPRSTASGRHEHNVQNPSHIHERTESRSRNEILSDPVRHLDTESNVRVADVLEAFNGTGFQSRNLASCLNVLMSCLKDPDRPTIFMGLAGAMVPGGLKKVIRDMLKTHVIDVLVSTGANLYHDIYEALGFRHYLAHGYVSDTELRDNRINRMLDVYADDKKFDDSDSYIKRFADSLEPRTYSTREFIYLLGKSLSDHNSVVATAAEEGIPVFCPAISDSSIGIALAAHRIEKVRKGESPIAIETIQDNLEIVRIKMLAKKSAAMFVGGGTPKNYIQQITPMAAVMKISIPGHFYGLAITTDDPKWGGLSGCTFEESQSWGKYEYEARFATVYCDATIALPLLFRSALDRKDEWYPRSRLTLESFDVTK